MRFFYRVNELIVQFTFLITFNISVRLRDMWNVRFCIVVRWRIRLASVSNYYGISNYSNYVTAITTITKLIFSYMKITALRHFELQQLRYNLLQPLQHITATNTNIQYTDSAVCIQSLEQLESNSQCIDRKIAICAYLQLKLRHIALINSIMIQTG